MSDLSDRLRPFKDRVQRHKKAAVRNCHDGNEHAAAKEFRRAHAAIDSAFQEIEGGGKFDPPDEGNMDEAAKEQAAALADWWGIRGGVFREEGKIDQAIDSYERGFAFEADPRFEINSTYNTVNRLVLRLLIDPDALSPGAPLIHTPAGRESLRQLLVEAGESIKQKWKKMNDPVWALADAVLVKTLLEAPDLPEWEQLFKEKAVEPFPFDSLGAVVKRLAQSQVPMAMALADLTARLDAHVASAWPQKQSTSTKT